MLMLSLLIIFDDFLLIFAITPFLSLRCFALFHFSDAIFAPLLPLDYFLSADAIRC